MDLFPQQKQEITLVQRMQAGMQLSMLLEKPREVFWKMINELENSPVFRKLHSFRGDQRVIKIKPIKKTIPLPDSRYAATGSLDVESLIEGRDEIITRIRSMGIDLFRYYFLEGEGTDAEISELLDLPPERVKEFRNGIIERIQIFDSLYTHTSPYPVAGSVSPVEVAADIHSLNGNLQVDYTRHKSRYEIDESKIDMLAESGSLEGEEAKGLKPLIAQMKRINERFNLLNQVIEYVVEAQKNYLINGDDKNIVILEEKRVAEKLDVDPSWISRIIKGKYIKIPGKIIPLRDLFISKRGLKKRIGKNLVRKILKEEQEGLEKGTLPHPYSDQNIKLIMEKRYKTYMTRRTINNWRREIGKEARKGEKG